MTNEVAIQLVNVRTLKIVELLTFKAEDLVAHDHADMDAFAVGNIAVTDRRPLKRPPQQRLRLLAAESKTNRPQGYFPSPFTPTPLSQPPNRRPKSITRLRTPAAVRFSRTAIAAELSPDAARARS